jgi:hypothetical protein
MPSSDQTESIVFERILSFLQESQLNEIFKLNIQPNFSEYNLSQLIGYRPDLLISKRNYPFMIVEVKARWQESALAGQEQIAEMYFEQLGVDYYLLATSNQLRLKTFKSNEGFRAVSYVDLFKLFRLTSLESDRNKDAQLIRETFYEAFKDAPEFRRDDRPDEMTIEEFVGDEEFKNVLQYNENGRFYHFTSEPGTLLDIEGQLFLELLEPIKETQVCRYTTLESLFQTLNYKSYRWASIVAMNDRSEIDYAYKQMNVFYKPLSSLSFLEMDELNKSFISSCTNIRKKDDLTMYRLYGDDSRGVCLVFDYDKSKERSNMLLREISYGEAHKRHDKLDRLAAFLHTLNYIHRIRFRFVYLDTWKHFFKSSDYALEEEIRLLYIEKAAFPPDNHGWVKSQPDQIISRYVTFDLDRTDFPLRLRTIILGPNCPDVAVNRRQLEVMLRSKGITNVDVEVSSIESYRKS